MNLNQTFSRVMNRTWLPAVALPRRLQRHTERGQFESSEDTQGEIGAETCPCTTGGACNEGLTCFSEVCVDLGRGTRRVDFLELVPADILHRRLGIGRVRGRTRTGLQRRARGIR